jgi:hypothetical protein
LGKKGEKMTKTYAVGLVFQCVVHVEADNRQEAREAAIAAEEDWGQQLSKCGPQVDWIVDVKHI